MGLRDAAHGDPGAAVFRVLTPLTAVAEDEQPMFLGQVRLSGQAGQARLI
jgi:hypothetical protein